MQHQRSLRDLFATLCLALATVGGAQAQGSGQLATLLSARSEMAFTTRQMGVPVEGKFGKFTAQIALDPKKPEAGRVSFIVDTASARFGTAELDAEVGKPGWLASGSFPQASFQSSAIKTKAAGRFEVSGRLTLKGATRDLVVPVQLAQQGGQSTASGSFVIRRLDFKIGEGEWAEPSLLANDVLVRFKLVLAGLAPL